MERTAPSPLINSPWVLTDQQGKSNWALISSHRQQTQMAVWPSQFPSNFWKAFATQRLPAVALKMYAVLLPSNQEGGCWQKQDHEKFWLCAQHCSPRKRCFRRLRTEEDHMPLALSCPPLMPAKIKPVQQTMNPHTVRLQGLLKNEKTCSGF